MHSAEIDAGRHACWLCLPLMADDQDIALCACGNLYLYDKWDEDADGNLTPRWRRCDERGRLLALRRTSPWWCVWRRTYAWRLPR